MLVILLGEIDLSVPWTITGTAIVVISASGSSNPLVASLAIPLGLCLGIAVGLLNAIGVAVFRVPAMVWTLAVNAMPVISAVVIGGTSIQGGRGNYIGTFAGAIFITLLSSILSVMQMPPAAREMIFGAIILVMVTVTLILPSVPSTT